MTFKVGLPPEHDLRKSLTKKPARRERRLMDCIDEYKRVEEDQQVMSVARALAEDSSSESKRAKGSIQPTLGFSEEDKIETIQPHDDALVVTLRIRGYDVKRVMVDQSSGVDIMYPDLYKELNLKLEDLTVYDSSLIRFKGKVVIPKRQIRLLVQSCLEVVEVDFIVVNAYSPYTTIMARPWLHALGAVSSTLHVKVKFPFGDQIEELVGSQSVARQCMETTILHQLGVGVQLPPQEKEELVMFLKKNVDVFAWNAYETLGVDPSFIFDHLNVNPAVEKTAFVTPIGNYHYKVMPFGLKNAKATYQRMMTRMFEPQMEKTIDVYMDDMVVKSKAVSMHVEDLNDTFQTLRKYKLCLNASKCSFGVGSSKFLGYMVTHRGIEVNPVQVRAINSLQPPRNPKEVQKLTGIIDALNWFISRPADR
ncbi:uncharacterized protein LOC142612349 [Castanea sativa]|uniref:uncharacterized protein LOC142612349 n=1 Tax=Castanea sativa TaxID=21020 RepID=UPI003F652196